MISSYSSLNRITTSLALVLAIYILVSLITLVSDAYQIRLLTSIMNYEYDYSTAISLADINDLWQAIISGIGLAVTILSTIILLYWFYRAYRNLPSLGAKVLKFNPKWVVVYFFIPILALWKPFKALEEIWILSTNTYPASSGKSSYVLLIWWILFIVSNLMGFTLGRTNELKNPLKVLVEEIIE
ncbi:MAG: DUF4328 domain-containing protein [Nitrososphaerales archaeon]